MTDIPAPPVTWVTVGDVAGELGVDPAAAVDDAWLASCTAAANDWCWRRRQKSGYCDDVPDVAPDASVKLGTIRYAARQYRQRGATSGVAEFQDLAGAWAGQAPSLADICSLLGVRRPVAS